MGGSLRPYSDAMDIGECRNVRVTAIEYGIAIAKRIGKIIITGWYTFRSSN